MRRGVCRRIGEDYLTVVLVLAYIACLASANHFDVSRLSSRREVPACDFARHMRRSKPIPPGRVACIRPVSPRFICKSHCEWNCGIAGYNCCRTSARAFSRLRTRRAFTLIGSAFAGARLACVPLLGLRAAWNCRRRLTRSDNEAAILVADPDCLRSTHRRSTFANGRLSIDLNALGFDIGRE